MKSIVILGLTHSQIPLVEKVREMGYRAITIGVGGGPPVAAEHADASFDIDTSDKDAVLELARDEDAAGLATCGTSTAMCTAAYVTEQLGLSDKVIPYEVALNAVFKDRFRRIIPDLLPQGTSSADVREAFRASRGLDYPLILKPGDGGGGKGITVIRETDENTFADAFRHATEHSRSKVVVVEEFIDGPVLGAESMVLDGEVHLLAVPDKTMTPPPRCITLGVVFPSRLPADLQDRIAAVNRAAIERLGIRWGPTHIDMAVDRNGQPKIIDIGPRLAGGALMAESVPDAYNYDAYGATIHLAVGRMPQPPGASNGLYYANWFLITGETGTVRSLRYSTDAAGTYNIGGIRQLIPNGTTIGSADSDAARYVTYTSKADSYDGVLDNVRRFAETIEIEVV